MDPMSLIMLALIGLLIIFMVRNGRKRKEQIAQMQQGMVPGAEVMLQSGIFGVYVDSVEGDDNKVILQSGDSQLVVHRQAIANIVTPVEDVTMNEESLAPDDDPTFGERLENTLDDADPTKDFPEAPEFPETPDAPDAPKN